MSELKNALQEQSEKKAPTIEDWIESKKGELERALPATIGINRMISVAITTLMNNPKLRNCTQGSLLAGLVTSAQLGLEINTPLGHAYLIPYKNNGKSEAQFQIGYQGLIELAFRTGKYAQIYSVIVYENDEFKVTYGLNRDLIHIPAEEKRGQVKGYYAVYKLTNGGYDFVYKTKVEMLAFAMDKSIPFKMGYNTPWKTDFDAMAKKTVLKMVLKTAPKSAEIANAMAVDGTIKNQFSSNMEIVPDETITEEPGLLDLQEMEEVTEEEKGK